MKVLAALLLAVLAVLSLASADVREKRQLYGPRYGGGFGGGPYGGRGFGGGFGGRGFGGPRVIEKTVIIRPGK